MPPAGRPNAEMPTAQQPGPGVPPEGRRTEPVQSPAVNPAQYKPPMSGSADAADPAIMELPPIDVWRQAS